MLARLGRAGTEFWAIDGQGGRRLLGTVAGGELACQASRAVLVCADPVGFLRAWEIPGDPG